MVRPRKRRFIQKTPNITYFKPAGTPLKELQEVIITFDELETMRLAHLEQQAQTQAAATMQVHQSTFQRTLTTAKQKITDALINGKAIKIEGGDYHMPQGDKTGPEGKGPRTGRGLGYCSGNNEAGTTTEKPRQGMRRGPRNGRGRT